MVELNGCVIAESLVDPTLINRLTVYRAHISEDNRKLDQHGGRGRWHLYWVRCGSAEVASVQQVLKPGWYAHFWEGTQVTVVYADRTFVIDFEDRTTWADAVAHGRAHGIPDDELDFLID